MLAGPLRKSILYLRTIPITLQSSFPDTRQSPLPPPPPNLPLGPLALLLNTQETGLRLQPLPLTQWLPSPSHLRVRQWPYIVFAPPGPLQALFLHSFTPP